MTKQKKLTAWAIVLKETGKIQTAAYFGSDGCDCCRIPDCVAIYTKKSEAIRERQECLNKDAQKVVKISITYPIE